MKTTRIPDGRPVFRPGNFIPLLCAIALVVLAAPDARASDPNGLYAFVDRVVFEPSEAAPERIQIWGGFAIAKGTHSYEYSDAERGYLYFKLRPGDEAVCKKEWADLKSVAGKQEIISFGSRREQGELTVRKADAKVEIPVVYPKSWGMTKIRMREYRPIQQLQKLMAETGEKGSPPAGQAPATKAAPKAGGK